MYAITSLTAIWRSHRYLLIPTPKNGPGGGQPFCRACRCYRLVAGAEEAVAAADATRESSRNGLKIDAFEQHRLIKCYLPAPFMTFVEAERFYDCFLRLHRSASIWCGRWAKARSNSRYRQSNRGGHKKNLVLCCACGSFLDKERETAVGSAGDGMIID